MTFLWPFLFTAAWYPLFPPIVSADLELCDDCHGIIVDTDCGADDAMAISLLLRAEEKGQVSPLGKVIGFTTLTGNTGAANVTRNVKALLSVLSRDELPVYQGSEDGLAAYVPPTWYYGYDGLGNFLPYSDPKPILPTDINPGLFIASTVHKYPHQVSILCIGPLTNLAMALHFNPAFFHEVKHVFILGGDYQGGGNISPGIEANMYSDPDAASYVFSKIPTNGSSCVTLLPLETIKNLHIPTSFRRDILGKHKSPLMDFLNNGERLTLPNYSTTWPCYDPTAASMLLDEAIIENKSPAWIKVVNQGPRGAMFASLTSQKNNVNIVTNINKDHLTNLLLYYLIGKDKSKI